uniref:KIB1-4 beta-propeller domain-containing protein n=1 Tax=Oryza nivara TaxID=4536 RepID=A0A0E0FQI9_ORYNI
MACPSRRAWSDGLPPELLAIIVLQLNCLADRACFSAVCRAWRDAAPYADAPQRGVPWLLLPARDAPSFFSLHSGATRRMRLPDGVRGTRFCGVHDGGWAAVAADTWRGFAVVNLFTGVRLPLPEKLRVEVPPGGNHDQFALAAGFTRHHMLIRTVVFSCPPTSPYCIAAAHVSSASNIAFCQPASLSTSWTAYRRDMDIIQDLIFHRGALLQGFHVLTNKEEVLVYAPTAPHRPSAPLKLACTRYSLRPRDDYQPDDALPPTFIATRYLAESRGKLLMVLRHYTGNPVVRRRTRMFRIFELTFGEPAEPRRAATPCWWVEIPELTGRALFLGRSCSRSVDVAQFPMLQEDTIYFLDDANLDLSMVLNNGSTYCNVDMGMYRKGEKIRPGARQFPREFTADCSPPIWLVP